MPRSTKRAHHLRRRRRDPGRRPRRAASAGHGKPQTCDGRDRSSARAPDDPESRRRPSLSRSTAKSATKTCGSPIAISTCAARSSRATCACAIASRRRRAIISTSQGFLEIETPILSKSTPEGARDFLVPSRLLPGKFYALPQAPQQYKQLLMVGGIEKYFQIAKCFRDEDLRADRQPEFTQIDIEASFVRPEDIFALTEGMLAAIFKAARGIDIPTPFPRMTYRDAIDTFGSDKPDRRFGLQLVDLSEEFRESGFKVFRGAHRGRRRGQSDQRQRICRHHHWPGRRDDRDREKIRRQRVSPSSRSKTANGNRRS